MTDAIFHGGRLDAAVARYGGAREEWIDLSTGINPNPYPVPVIPNEAWARLPDVDAEQKLLVAARDYYQVPDEFEIVAVPGTQAIIELLPRVLNLREVSIVAPTYAEHAHSWEKAGVEAALVDKPSTRVGGGLVVVNPNNPTASIWRQEDLLQASKDLDWLIVDEAFCDAVADHSLVHSMEKSFIILKSFGKFFGLAGLRLGFVICNSEFATQIRSMLGPWSVSGPALTIGRQAFDDKEWIDATIARLDNDSASLAKLLEGKGFSLYGRTHLFVSVYHSKAAKVHNALANEHILVRPFEHDPDLLRFGLCRDQQQFGRLSQALSAISSG